MIFTRDELDMIAAALASQSAQSARTGQLDVSLTYSDLSERVQDYLDTLAAPRAKGVMGKVVGFLVRAE